jgi:NADH-quinone oxidoreductase subunit C
MINHAYLLEELQPLFNKELSISEDGQSILVRKEDVLELLQVIKGLNCDILLADITAVDYCDYYEVVYHLLRLKSVELIKIKAKVLSNNPVISSISGLWRAADVQEREIYDLMGITFEGHSNLKRILCPDDFDGNPLKKEYKLNFAERF